MQGIATKTWSFGCDFVCTIKNECSGLKISFDITNIYNS